MQKIETVTAAPRPSVDGLFARAVQWVRANIGPDEGVGNCMGVRMSHAVDNARAVRKACNIK